MDQVFLNILRTARPRQWLKNFSLFAALIFSGRLFLLDSLLRVVLAFVIFSILASSTYLFNDIVDIPLDRRHPIKSKRPVASGKLPLPLVFFLSVAGVFLSLALALKLSFFFFITSLAYFVLQLMYSLWLKQVAILDLLTIATGFILRVYAGAFVLGAHMNVWFLLTVVSLSLFLAVGKRQSERTLLIGRGEKLAGHRSTLAAYHPRLLDVYTSMFANATWITYAMFTFLHDQPIVSRPYMIGLIASLPQTLVYKKWLMITVPVVVYGVMRYLQLIYLKKEGESPDEVLISDKPLLASVLTWVFLVIFVIYGIG